MPIESAADQTEIPVDDFEKLLDEKMTIDGNQAGI